jgi:hypothetical protein
MTVLGKSLLAATVGVAVLAGSSLTASAYVACTGLVCWHATERYEYPTTARVVIHDDGWKWKRHEHYRWREHEGRGFWHGSRWENW